MNYRLREYYNDSESADVSDATALLCEDKTLTKQSMADDCDINVIMERMKVGYEVPADVRVPRYGDFTAVTNFEDAMNAIRAAELSFMEMSGKTRARFSNNPQEFLEFCEARNSNGELENYDEMLKLGLAVPKPAVVEPAVVKVEVVNQPGPVLT